MNFVIAILQYVPRVHLVSNLRLVTPLLYAGVKSTLTVVKKLTRKQTNIVEKYHYYILGETIVELYLQLRIVYSCQRKSIRQTLAAAEANASFA